MSNQRAPPPPTIRVVYTRIIEKDCFDILEKIVTFAWPFHWLFPIEQVNAIMAAKYSVPVPEDKEAIAKASSVSITEQIREGKSQVLGMLQVVDIGVGTSGREGMQYNLCSYSRRRKTCLAKKSFAKALKWKYYFRIIMILGWKDLHFYIS